jgi:hypothetical protein
MTWPAFSGPQSCTPPTALTPQHGPCPEISFGDHSNQMPDVRHAKGIIPNTQIGNKFKAEISETNFTEDAQNC